MDYSKRTNDWVDKFLNHLDATNPDLKMYFHKNIYFSPDVNNPSILFAAYTPLKTTNENKELKDRMFTVFENFFRSNPV